MNRRSFLRSLFASTATIVVAPAAALEALDTLVPSTRTYVDMGRNVTKSEIERLLREVNPHIGSIRIDPSGGAMFRWEPIHFSEDERVRTYASGGWHLVQLAPQRINHASRASEGSS